MTHKDNNNPIRVLFVSPNTRRGGAPAALVNLMLDLKKRYNVVISLLVPSSAENYYTELCKENGIELFRAHFYSWIRAGNLRSSLKAVVKTILNKIFRRQVISLFKGRHFDIIHTNSSITETGSIIAEALNIPHVWHIRECSELFDDTYYLFTPEYMRSRFYLAAASVSISQRVREYWVNERKTCPPEKSHVIYDGVKVKEPYEKRKPSERINFCLLGQVVPGKNQLMAVKALSFLKEYAGKFMLHLIGYKNSEYAAKYRRDVNSIIASSGLEDHVKFWGFRNDVDKILHDMDVGLMLSRFEGFGLVTVECMMNYMPVIGVNTGATPELVADGETGFICQLDDSEKLAELMIRFIENPELIASMGKAGRERAVKNFPLEKNTDSIYSLYQEILSR